MKTRQQAGRYLVSAGMAVLVLAALAARAAWGQAKTIYDIQYTADPTGDSPEAGNVIDCAGGIVVHKWSGGQFKLTLYDPNHPDGWGGIQVKDWEGGALFLNVSLGDWVSLTGVYVEEYRGNTILQYDHTVGDPGFSVKQTGLELPDPIVVAPTEIEAPVEGPPDEWYVDDHAAEKYEHMWLKVQTVTVGQKDMGKAVDNYELSGPGGTCWAADYMNDDAAGDYHELVQTGQAFQSVTGILEQYTKLTSGWDYYQFVTTKTGDFVVPEPATLALLAVGMAAGLVRRRTARRRS